ncbi:MAG TPA: hypothetical protein VGE45_00350 [Chloroflexia bacterium]|jgi:hypothetical protein
MPSQSELLKALIDNTDSSAAVGADARQMQGTTEVGEEVVGNPVVVGGVVGGAVQVLPLVGLVAAVAAVAATGMLTLSDQGTTGRVLTINGVAFGIATSGQTLGGTIINRGVDETAFATNIAAVLNAHASPLVRAATYVVDTGVFTSVVITHDTPGAAGNAFTISTNDPNLTPSGATLTGGEDAVPAVYGVVVDNSGVEALLEEMVGLLEDIKTNTTPA